MKIAIWHNLRSGGGKRALFHHVRGLHARGHEIELWSPPTADLTYLPLAPYAREHTLPLAEPTVSRSGLRRFTYDYRAVRERLRAMEEHCRLCAEEINAGGFDVFIAHPCIFYRVTPIGKFVDLPKLVYVQEPNRWLYEALPRLRWLAMDPPQEGVSWWRSRKFMAETVYDVVRTQAARLEARAEFEAAAAYDVRLVNSYFSREAILRAYGLEASVCYLGIDTDLFVYRHLPRERFIVGISAFVREKNIELAIRGLAEIPAAERPRLVWIGNLAVPEDYIDTLSRLANSLGVEFEPRLRIEDEEMVDLLNRAAAMIYAPRLEPFGYAPLEANACGVPVVAVAEGGVRETIQDGVNGRIVDPDPTAVAAAVQGLLGDNEVARTMGENGARLAASVWSLEKSIDRVERYLQDAVSARKSGGAGDTRVRRELLGAGSGKS